MCYSVGIYNFEMLIVKRLMHFPMIRCKYKSGSFAIDTHDFDDNK